MIINATPASIGTPAVDLLVDAMPAGTAKVTVHRLVAGTQDVVRDANQAPTSGSTTRPYVDWEVPLGEPVTYVAYAYAAGGASLGSAQSTSVTITSTETWMSDPLAPALTRAVTLIAESVQTVTHDTPGDIQNVLESGLAVAVMGTTQDASSVPLRISTTLAGRDPVLDILYSANPFLLRCPPEAGFDLPPLAYLAHTSVSTERIAEDKVNIVMDVQAVAAPTSPVVLAARTYGDLKAEASSYGDVMLQRDSYLVVLRGY